MGMEQSLQVGRDRAGVHCWGPCGVLGRTPEPPTLRLRVTLTRQFHFQSPHQKNRKQGAKGQEGPTAAEWISGPQDPGLQLWRSLKSRLRGEPQGFQFQSQVESNLQICS